MMLYKIFNLVLYPNIVCISRESRYGDCLLANIVRVLSFASYWYRNINSSIQVCDFFNRLRNINRFNIYHHLCEINSYTNVDITENEMVDRVMIHTVRCIT